MEDKCVQRESNAGSDHVRQLLARALSVAGESSKQ